MGKTKSTQEALQNEIVKMEELLKKKETAVGNAKVMAALNKQLEQIKKHSYGKKRQRALTSRNSGLEKVMPITQKLADFAGWDVETPKSRVEITRFLCGYIKEHNLQNQDNKKEIILDSGLSDLLQYSEKTITYPHIQKYIHLLFAKTGDDVLERVEEEEPEKEPEEKPAVKKTAKKTKKSSQ
jgi:chromatin remodeling complex protein RSC6